jgi:hypothetical protein
MTDAKRHGFTRFLSWLLLGVGYLLSPLSWWNDLVVNWPLAYLFANLVGLVSHRLFGPSLVAGYWLTNILGLVMMQQGTVRLATAGERPMSRRQLWVSIAVASGYTLAAVVLLRLGVLKPIFTGR